MEILRDDIYDIYIRITLGQIILLLFELKRRRTKTEDTVQQLQRVLYILWVCRWQFISAKDLQETCLFFLFFYIRFLRRAN